MRKHEAGSQVVDMQPIKHKNKSSLAASQMSNAVGEIRITDENGMMDHFNRQLDAGKYAQNPSTITLGHSANISTPLISNDQLHE